VSFPSEIVFQNSISFETRELGLYKSKRITSAFTGYYHTKSIGTIFNCSVTTIKKNIKRNWDGEETSSYSTDGSGNKKTLEIHKETIKNFMEIKCSISIRAFQQRLLKEFLFYSKYLIT
ncbi:hypothetical protein CDIK_4283, partial [Cucumispora dikerogammari]